MKKYEIYEIYEIYGGMLWRYGPSAGSVTFEYLMYSHHVGVQCQWTLLASVENTDCTSLKTSFYFGGVLHLHAGNAQIIDIIGHAYLPKKKDHKTINHRHH